MINARFVGNYWLFWVFHKLTSTNKAFNIYQNYPKFHRISRTFYQTESYFRYFHIFYWHIFSFYNEIVKSKKVCSNNNLTIQ